MRIGRRLLVPARARVEALEELRTRRGLDRAHQVLAEKRKHACADGRKGSRLPSSVPREDKLHEERDVLLLRDPRREVRDLVENIQLNC